LGLGFKDQGRQSREEIASRVLAFKGTGRAGGGGIVLGLVVAMMLIMGMSMSMSMGAIAYRCDHVPRAVAAVLSIAEMLA
jgi:hypothetical protein